MVPSRPSSVQQEDCVSSSSVSLCDVSFSQTQDPLIPSMFLCSGSLFLADRIYNPSLLSFTLQAAQAPLLERKTKVSWSARSKGYELSLLFFSEFPVPARLPVRF